MTHRNSGVRADFTCPICLQSGGTRTREHLPLRALYTQTGDQDQADPAIIKICQRSNNQKSIWDQEVLAQYGHVMGEERARKAQQSIRNRSTLPNALEIAVAVSRIATQTGQIRDIRYGGIPCDTVSQWMSYCAPGIYAFFEKKPFRGLGMRPIPQLFDHNISANRFKMPDENCHRINSSCSIALFRPDDTQPKMAMVFLRSPENRLFSFSTLLFEDDDQRQEFERDRPIIEDPRPMRVMTPRDIFCISRKDGELSYRGVKKVKDPS